MALVCCLAGRNEQICFNKKGLQTKRPTWPHLAVLKWAARPATNCDRNPHLDLDRARVSPTPFDLFIPFLPTAGGELNKSLVRKMNESSQGMLLMCSLKFSAGRKWAKRCDTCRILASGRYDNAAHQLDVPKLSNNYRSQCWWMVMPVQLF